MEIFRRGALDDAGIKTIGQVYLEKPANVRSDRHFFAIDAVVQRLGTEDYLEDSKADRESSALWAFKLVPISGAIFLLE